VNENESEVLLVESMLVGAMTSLCQALELERQDATLWQGRAVRIWTIQLVDILRRLELKKKGAK